MIHGIATTVTLAGTEHEQCTAWGFKFWKSLWNYNEVMVFPLYLHWYNFTQGSTLKRTCRLFLKRVTEIKLIPNYTVTEYLFLQVQMPLGQVYLKAVKRSLTDSLKNGQTHLLFIIKLFMAWFNLQFLLHCMGNGIVSPGSDSAPTEGVLMTLLSSGSGFLRGSRFLPSQKIHAFCVFWEQYCHYLGYSVLSFIFH